MIECATINTVPLVQSFFLENTPSNTLTSRKFFGIWRQCKRGASCLPRYLPDLPKYTRYGRGALALFEWPSEFGGLRSSMAS